MPSGRKTMATPYITLVSYFLVLLAPSMARTWTDVVDPKDMSIHDYKLSFLLFEQDPFLSMETDTQPPIPSASPQALASLPTTAVPPPTMEQTRSPTASGPVSTLQTGAPTTFPTIYQTPAPTVDNYPENPIPSNPPSSYFNYDTGHSNPYGPGYPQLQRYNDSTLAVGYLNNGWANYQAPSDNFYWSEFDNPGFGPWAGVLAKWSPERNRCSNIGQQSPIDVRPNARCYPHHQIRDRPGDFKVTDAGVQKLIEPNKLRLKYERRPCSDYKNSNLLIYTDACSEPDPPKADFPHGWGGYTDAIHVDFKIPSEHMIQGRRYDGEMQIYDIHPGRKRTPTRAVVMEASPSGFNYYLQAALDAFQYAYNLDKAQCAAKQRRDRRMISEVHHVLGNSNNTHHIDYKTWANYSTDLDDPDFESNRKLQDRLLQYGIWNPHNVQLVPSIHFYRYDGSLTEPPCGEWVSWFVCDQPMQISDTQLEQMKRLIFTHVDGDCNRTSVHYQQSVARPIQDTGGRPVAHCTKANFMADGYTPP